MKHKWNFGIFLVVTVFLTSAFQWPWEQAPQDGVGSSSSNDNVQEKVMAKSSSNLDMAKLLSAEERKKALSDYYPKAPNNVDEIRKYKTIQRVASEQASSYVKVLPQGYQEAREIRAQINRIVESTEEIRKSPNTQVKEFVDLVNKAKSHRSILADLKTARSARNQKKSESFQKILQQEDIRALRQKTLDNQLLPSQVLADQARRQNS